MTTKPILITLHGGCFVGGSATWDVPQTKCLENCGFDVHQLDFPKNDLNETIKYIYTYIQTFKTPIYLLGRSSGGYLAKILYDRYPDKIKKVLYLAPVFNPKLRALINPKFKDKQDKYFKNSEYIDTSLFNKKDEILILAENDENVPKECYTEEQLKNAIYIGIKTHKGLTTTTSQLFRSIIINILHINID